MHLIPGVTHGGVHITEVQLIRCRQHALGHQVAAADHQLRIPQIDLLDRQGQQRQILLHVADAPRELLNRTGADAAPTQPAARP